MHCIEFEDWCEPNQMLAMAKLHHLTMHGDSRVRVVDTQENVAPRMNYEFYYKKKGCFKYSPNSISL